MTLPLPEPPANSTFPNDSVVAYSPHSVTLSWLWKNGADVLQHLLTTQNERQHLLKEVRHRAQGRSHYYIIYHPLLNYDVVAHSSYTDCHLVMVLSGCWALEKGRLV